ncbi:uncharacterized protein LOC129216337 [Uloborus diversus]|uniref:uncharacterized protein LOC129216337 n=1 Tax=Uloborus diversus TaxID=327109 RepID=UPI002409C075|nr:uncharacterized protein LOC129216337 [Uloborus diversus]
MGTTNISRKLISLVALVHAYLLPSVSSHARLMEPPSRSSMWRFGYDTPVNYDDDGLYCGGIKVQWKKNNGKCGVCGDPWHLPTPRPNEAGGKYGQGIIVRSYKTGQVIQTVVDITANHRGYFMFRVCPSKHPKKEVIQECLDKHVLKVVNSTSTKYYVENHGKSRVTLSLRLPKSLTCKHCVFQWTYTAGNNWGKCNNGSFALSCGQQETFRACADIAIGQKNRVVLPSNTTNKKNETQPDINKQKIPVVRPETKKQKIPIFRPPVIRNTAYEDAIEQIRNNPKLRWMLQPKKGKS